MKKFILITIILIVYSDIYSQDKNASSSYPNGKITGVVFGDYFYKAGGDSTVSTLDFTAFKKDYNSIEFRRIFLGYEHNFSENFFSKVTVAYEGISDLASNGKRNIILKDAYLIWKSIFSNTNLTFGLFPTIAFSYHSEKFWGNRFIEKMILDQRGITASRDMGLMVDGAFDYKGDFGYHAMIATGSGATIERNKYKKFSGLLFGNFAEKKFYANLYADYEPYGSDKSKTTLNAFMAYQIPELTLGLESFISIQKNFNVNVISSPGNIEPLGVSFFIRGNVSGDKIKFFSRYDYYNPDSRTAQYDYYNHFVTAGIDYLPIPNVHISPNIWLNAYAKKNANNPGRKTDVIPRITFSYDVK